MDPVMELLQNSSNSSSSSSSSDFENILAVILPEAAQSLNKNENFAETTVNQYNERQFMEHFKIKRNIVQSLASEFKNSEFYPEKDTGFKRITAEKCILIFCWFATHEAASFRDVGDRFGIAISTLHLIIENVGRFLSLKSNSVIMWPSEEEKLQILDDFDQMGFQGVLGCIDGTHIRIDTPNVDPESYFNRKKYYSIQMQAVCDSQRRIRDVFIGFPGSVHDGRVFRNSPLFHTLQAKCGENYILADSAYPCLKTVMTPYKNYGNLTPVERNFNKKLSSCRILIEHTFGVLKQKFRQLYHLKLRSIESMCHFIRACCVLYNLNLGNYEEDETEQLNADEHIEMEVGPDHYEGDEVGFNYRNYIASLLYN